VILSNIEGGLAADLVGDEEEFGHANSAIAASHSVTSPSPYSRRLTIC
jgi:hypothetical protein